MTWNTSLVDGPITIPIYGPADPVTGIRPVTGVQPGYHINPSRSLVTPEMAQFEVSPPPVTPVQIFSGDTQDESGQWQLTAFLVFADEAEAEAVLSDYVNPES